MSYRLFWLWLSSACIFADAAHAQPSAHWDLPALMATLAQSQAGVVRFTERKMIEFLKEPLTLSGVLDFQRPSHLEKRITVPYEERYLVEGDALTIIQPANQVNRQLSLAEYPALQAFVESIRAPLAGDQATLQRFYRVSLGGTSRNWLLALVPLDAEMAKLVRTVQVRGGGDRIREIRIEEASGDSSVMTIEPMP